MQCLWVFKQAVSISITHIWMIMESVKIRMEPERPQEGSNKRRDATRVGEWNKPNIDTKLLRITQKKHELSFILPSNYFSDRIHCVPPSTNPLNSPFPINRYFLRWKPNKPQRKSFVWRTKSRNNNEAFACPVLCCSYCRRCCYSCRCCCYTL